MRAACWLAFLAPLFFLTYGAANELAGSRDHVPSIVFGWERHIPFLAWTIIPYWSMDPLYALSLFVCRSRPELDMHARRLITAQGFLFETLARFDKPFNQAPSLHIALLVLLWVRYAQHARRIWTSLLHCWFALIAVSVLTTWQHHFIDVPTGALLGLLFLWLRPDATKSPRRSRCRGCGACLQRRWTVAAVAGVLARSPDARSGGARARPPCRSRRAH
jgi:membrane-associated phospholipid phosphatase